MSPSSAPATSSCGRLPNLSPTIGLRLGELLGLRWRDIDLDRGRLSIQRTLQRLRGGVISAQPTKTHRSRRPVDLSDIVVEASATQWRR